jgi:hypothetical protein
MPRVAASRDGAIGVPRLRDATQPIHAALLWLTGASGALVFIEPSPYEVVTLLTMIVFVAGGLVLRPALLPLATLFVLLNIGFSISAVPFLDDQIIVNWVITSWYMATTVLFFAAMLGANTAERLAFLTRGYVIAGVIASLAAVAGYFHLIPGTDELLLLYDRARGTFKDPNVLGAFLVLPALVCLQRVLIGGLRDVVRGGALLLLISAAIFLSFSRGAWGQLVLTSVVLMFLMFITTRSNNQRLRIVVLAVAGVAVVTLFIAALLSIGTVADLFKQRASLEQDYDVGQLGRFGRHVLGALLALDKPFGIGPRQFSHYFPEDTHNSYLNAFMSGGWLSGAIYPTITALTLFHATRQVFVPSPWRSTYLVYYAAFVGTAGESFIIDTDHWRHYFLFIGVLWGLILAARAGSRAAAEPSAAPEPLRAAKPALAPSPSQG